MRYLLQGEKAIFGFRGRVIVHFALLWIFVGLTLIGSPLKPAAEALEKHHGTAFIYALLPVWAQVGIWIVSGLASVFFCRTLPSRYTDHYAFQILIIPPALIFFSYLSGIVFNLVAYHVFIEAYAQGLPVWGFFLSIVLTVSRWPEPSVGTVVRERV